MSEFKLPTIEGVLYCLHRQGHTPQYAHAELLSITGKETMSQEDVVDFFGMINHGTFGIKKIDEDSKLHLTQQVDEVYDKIMENLDLTGRLSLLTTCKQLREVSQSRELHIKTMTINLSSNYFQILTDNGYEKTVLLTNHSKNTKEWTRSYYSFMGKIKTELKNVFQFETIRIDSLNLMMENGSQKDRYVEFISMMRKSLATRRTVRVKNVKTNCPSYLICNKILRFVRGLKHVKFVEQHLRLINCIDDIHGMSDVERFTSVQDLETIRIVQNFGHIPYCKIVLITAPTVAVLMELKEKLLLNPKLQQFKIRTRRSLEVYNKLNEHFKTYIMPGAKIPIIQTFNYPGSQTDKLSFYATDQLFWFKGPCFKDDGEPDEEPEGVDDGFAEEEDDDSDGRSSNSFSL